MSQVVVPCRQLGLQSHRYSRNEIKTQISATNVEEEESRNESLEAQQQQQQPTQTP